MHTLTSIIGRFLLPIWMVFSLSADPILQPTEQDLEFFEKQVRPVLAENCFTCHSQQAEKLKGGLFLDTREGMLRGGDTGPAIAPGDPEKSLLIRAVRYTDDNLQMPPKNKRLSPSQVLTLERWIQSGALMPRPLESAAPVKEQRGRSHWAFQPVRKPAIPQVHQTGWIQEPIDNFILAKLEANHLAPSSPADRHTIMRRVFFDLIGLPPSPGEVERFLSDDAPDAFAKVVDRLLASPQYGERWSRYWLDIARYSDTKGYVFEEERRYPYAYTYRDYVIRAFNDDLPFNQFIVEQIAADQLPLGADKRPLAALGFLTLGRRFLNNQPDIIDDRIDVVTRGMMGLTVACARCHDHKYDPIPTKDYYSLYGIFASCSEPEEKPLLGQTQLPPAYPDYLRDHQRRAEELQQFRQSKEAEVQSQVRQLTGAYLLAAYDVQQLTDQSKEEALARERKLDPGILQRWVRTLAESASQSDPVLGLWLTLSQCAPEEFPQTAPVVLETYLSRTNGPSPNRWIVQMFSGAPPNSMLEVADRYGAILGDVERGWRETQEVTRSRGGKQITPSSGANREQPAGIEPNPPPDGSIGQSTPYSDPCFEELRQLLYSTHSPCTIPEAEFTRFFDVPSIQKLRSLKRQVEELDATHPGAPARAMALQDNPVPVTPHVFIRGNPANPGPEITRHFPAILSGRDPKPFQQGSGRLELARAIANPENPLTARVLVNRVWLHYFGAGLVRTPSDFGLRSDPPSHPELLDYLASRFMEEGWSLKKLHRSIVLSAVYQQSTDANPAAEALDSGNQWLWRMNRRRLDFEALRDTLLAAAGNLELTEGGHSVDITVEPFTSRRTVYSFVERQNLPGLFRTFDFANPDTTSPQRFTTTVPQQALFMINSSFVGQQARRLAARCAPEPNCDPRPSIQLLYQLVHQRSPNARELALALSFLGRQNRLEPFIPEPEAWQYGYGAFDRASQTLTEFHPLPHFTNEAWQLSSTYLDPQAGRLQLKAAGGHSGRDHQHAAVRRWIAPRDLVVTVSGALRDDSTTGEGVEAWICSTRNGALGSWAVRHAKNETKLEPVSLKKGETLDFIVDGSADSDSANFAWAPVIREANLGGNPPAGLTTNWEARQDFSGPKPALPQSFDGWERFAQVLLMSNEFCFLD